MSELNGILGAVDNMHTVRNWRASINAAVQSFVASNTKGMTGHVKGNKDWNGQFQAYGASPSIYPGDTFDFLGSLDGAKGIAGPAIVDSVEIAIDTEAGAIIQNTVNFSGNGEVELGQAAAITDTEDPDAYSSIPCKAQSADPGPDPSFTDILHFRSANINLSANNVAYVSSETDGWTKRKKGNLQASGSLSFYSSDEDLSNAARLFVNTFKFLRIFSDLTNYWDLQAVIFSSISDVVIDREAAAMVGFSANFEYTGHWREAGDWKEGTIVAPDATVWWPPAS